MVTDTPPRRGRRRRAGWVVLVLLSVAAAALLVVHLIWPGRVDSVALGLLALMALPGLGLILDSAELPGGIKVQFRNLEQRVARTEESAEVAMGAITEQATLARHRELVGSPPPFRSMSAVTEPAPTDGVSRTAPVTMWPTPAAYCRRCGTPRAGGDRFCETCGHRFENESAADTPGRRPVSWGSPGTGTAASDDPGYRQAADDLFGSTVPVSLGDGPPPAPQPPESRPQQDPSVPEPVSGSPGPAAPEPDDDSSLAWYPGISDDPAVSEVGAAGPGDHRQRDGLPSVAELADEYLALRQRLHSGPERTRRMTVLVGRLFARTASEARFDPAAALISWHGGMRLAGYAYAYTQRDHSLVRVVLGAVETEPLPFNRYWGLRALGQLIPGAGPDLLPADLVHRLTALRPVVARDPSCAGELERIVGSLAAR